MASVLTAKAPLPTDLNAWCQSDTPWKSGFISTLRAIAARTPDQPPVGHAALPSQESFRIGQRAHMAFAPREIAQLSWRDGKVNLHIFGPGVWGAQGAMPLHFTELTYSRMENHDYALADFVDLFHHRALSHFYRAWFIAQDTATLDRTDDEKFAFYVGSLAGLDLQEIAHSCLPAHARLTSCAHLVREPRNPEGLLGALQDYFQVPVQIKEFVGHWIQLDRPDQTHLGNGDTAILLGKSAILGETVLDRQHKFQLIIGPLTLEQYLRFSPWGQDLPVLKEWVRNFIGFEYAWEVQLLLKAQEVPCTSLDGAHQLGYASWLAREASLKPLYGMCFEPEFKLNG
ncbi:type VI secretion system baseplate subunit TssG [Cronobacter turicensis]|nr:type VI secretion system baseplate subunit TssG [Cronobacter turicensis]EKY1993546.1 type VI secretion system baseplate subunit TssG [Cronobacter turicensis]